MITTVAVSSLAGLPTGFLGCGVRGYPNLDEIILKSHDMQFSQHFSRLVRLTNEDKVIPGGPGS
jgi:hypothetical protein